MNQQQLLLVVEVVVVAVFLVEGAALLQGFEAGFCAEAGGVVHPVAVGLVVE